MKNILGYFLIFIAVVLLIYVGFSSPKVKKNQTFSNYTFLSSSWEKYKGQFINKDGRVIDYSQDGITTSEGQSYAMLRAVWIGDKPTFDLVWKWTKENMKREKDNLFGWRWGKKPNGSYGFEKESDLNSAADADSDIALALILASKRWEDKSYESSAKNILSDMWKIEVAHVNGKNYLIAGNWAKNNDSLVINPSYFSPYAYRYFARVDSGNNWESLISSGYELLTASSTLPLDKGKSVGLPPDWVSVASPSGQISHANMPNLTTDYSYEAVRIPWRIYLDYQWNKSKEAEDYLKSSFNFLVEEYKKNNKLASVYSHDGSVVQQQEGPTMYATALSFLALADPNLAKNLYEDKILSLYSNDTNSFNSKLPYYEQNWLWLGSALYNKQLSKF